MRFYNESKHNIKKRHFLEKCLPNIKNSLPIIYFNFETKIQKTK